MSTKRLSAAALTLASAAVLLGPAADGEVVVRERFVIDDDHIEQVEHGAEWCPQVPFLVRFQGTGRGSFLGVRRGDGLVYFADHVRIRESYTNVQNGKSLSQKIAVNSKDQTIVDNGDGTLTIIFKVTGRTFVYGPDGSRLFVDAGVFMGELLVDHNGTPGNPEDDGEPEFIGEVKLAGRHDTADRDFCADVLQFLS